MINMADVRIPLYMYVIVLWIEVLKAFDLSHTIIDSRSAESPILVIAHRGSSGVLPEHTAAAYRRAIEDGADYVECDVTLTRDLVPVCLHENWLNETTDVATRSEFANRRRNLTIEEEGVEGQRFDVDDWFAVDFTLAELKTLRVKQRFNFRDQSNDGLHQITTLAEHLAIVRGASHLVGSYPELKNPHWLNSLEIMQGRRFEDILLDELERNGYKERNDPCIIQSFSEESLYYLANRTTIRLAMLIENDVPSESKMAEWSERGIYAVGTWLNLITPFWTNDDEYKNWINGTTDLVSQCHRHGLKVHAYTFRNEDRYLAWDFEQDIYKAYDFYVHQMNVDGFFTDFPETLVNFRSRVRERRGNFVP